MTFQTHDLGSQLAYENFARDIIIAVEGDSNNLYIDSKGIPTIGIGWNLQAGDNLEKFLNQVVGVDAGSSFKSGSSYLALLSTLGQILAPTFTPNKTNKGHPGPPQV